MSSVVKIAPEYRNEGRLNKYPFVDYATLIDKGGHTLPEDFIIDIHITAIDAVAPLYIDTIDFVHKTISISDSLDKQVAFIDYSNDDFTAYEHFEAYGFKRPVGKVVIDTEYESTAIHTFNVGAAELTASNYLIVNQRGVRGIIIDNEVLTGDITFEGVEGGGVEVYSYIEDNNKILEFQLVGDPDDRRLPGPVCVEVPPTIQSICVSTSAGSPLAFAAETVAEVYATDIDGNTVTMPELEEGGKYPDYVHYIGYIIQVGSDYLRVSKATKTTLELDSFVAEDDKEEAYTGSDYAISVITPNKLYIRHRHCNPSVPPSVDPGDWEDDTEIDDICVTKTGPRYPELYVTNLCDEDPESPCDNPERELTEIDKICLYPLDNTFWIIPQADRSIISVDASKTQVDLQTKSLSGLETVQDIRGTLTVSIVGLNNDN